MTETIADLYRKRRKNVNENLGLLIALAACGAAMWTGYEARHTRLEAANIADQSLKVQHESVQAQITAVRFDERPYIRVATVGVKPADKEDTDDDYRAVFKLVAIGRTPATFLNWNVYCAVWDANQITGVVQTEKEGLTKAQPNGELIVLADTGLTRTTSNGAVLNSGDSIQVHCPFSQKDYQSGKDDVEIDTDKQITTDRSTMMTFIVDVTYSDVFDSKHRTQQCFYIPIGDSPIRKKLLSCQKYKPVIE
jgi:hypothetical protein